MSSYKLSKFKDDVRTDAYVMTVETKEDPNLLALKENIKRQNAHSRAYIRDLSKTPRKRQSSSIYETL